MIDDLVERVARAICETENGPCKCMPDECGCTYWKAHARAAIAVCMEEAAKVVTEHYQELCTEHRLLLVNRAAAIRALVKEPTDPGPGSDSDF